MCQCSVRGASFDRPHPTITVSSKLAKHQLSQSVRPSHLMHKPMQWNPRLHSDEGRQAPRPNITERRNRLMPTSTYDDDICAGRHDGPERVMFVHSCVCRKCTVHRASCYQPRVDPTTTSVGSGRNLKTLCILHPIPLYHCMMAVTYGRQSKDCEQ